MIYPQHKKYYFIITFSDYQKILGGVNRVILAQIEQAKAKGISTVSICPVRVVKGIVVNNQWLIRVDNRPVLICTDQQVIAYLFKLSKANYDLLAIQVHHILRMNISSLVSIIKALDAHVYFYIHDFYTVCSHGLGNLLMDDGSLCRVALCEKTNCENCSCLNNNTSQVRRFIRGLNKKVTFIAPSDSCKKIWTSFYTEHIDRTIVIYHQKLLGEYCELTQAIEEKSIINIAFVGAQSKIKGWDDFKYIVKELTEGKKLFCIGGHQESISNVTNISVDFHDGLEAMTKKLRDYKIDVVLLLSRCPETYSYTYYESIAAGAFIIAYDVSGNIADQINQRGNGKIFNSKENIIKYLNDIDQVIADVNFFRKYGQRGPLRLEENDEFLTYLINEHGLISEDAANYKLNLPMGKTKAALYELEWSVKKLFHKK